MIVIVDEVIIVIIAIIAIVTVIAVIAIIATVAVVAIITDFGNITRDLYINIKTLGILKCKVTIRQLWDIILFNFEIYYINILSGEIQN